MAPCVQLALKREGAESAVSSRWRPGTAGSWGTACGHNMDKQLLPLSWGKLSFTEKLQLLPQKHILITRKDHITCGKTHWLERECEDTAWS